ncbi:MAG TPA: hypothetical protein PLC99_22550 [Verrucomicrobiota bacterium]|nr:hypothetical protein [Verrucomicrobiota bacterium]
MRNQGKSWIVVHKHNGSPLLLQGWPLKADTEEKAAKLLELYVAFSRQDLYAVKPTAEEDSATAPLVLLAG